MGRRRAEPARHGHAATGRHGRSAGPGRRHGTPGRRADPGSPGRRRAAPPRRSRAARRRIPRPLALLSLVGLLVAAGFAVPALLPERTARPQRASPTAPQPQATSVLPSPTAPADLSALPIAREPFCDRLDRRYAAAALGGQVEARTSYRPGDRVPLAPGVTEVVHEFGCTFRSGDARAAAWVFAAPVEGSEASGLVEEAEGERGCRSPGDTLQYGTPDVVTVCRLTGDRVEVTARGLYGRTWLSCRLTADGDPDEVLARAETWCLHVATSLGARP